MGKIQARFLTLIFMIPGNTTFSTFTQVSSFMYADFFGIKQYTYGNINLVNKLVPMILG